MKTVSFGRSSENDVVVQDVLVSGRHLLLSSDEAGKLFAEDLNSTNGTWIDDTFLRGGRQAITYDSLIKIGETVLDWQNHFRDSVQVLPEPQAVLPTQLQVVEPEFVLPTQPEPPITQAEPTLPATEYVRTDKPTQWLFWTAVGMGGFLLFLLLFWYFTFVKGV